MASAPPVHFTKDIRERLDWLDALKGLGIIAVVAGHLWTRGAFRNSIYCFHMPLFFMASGAVTRAMPVRLLAPRLLLALGLPALSFALLFLGLDFWIEGMRHVRPIFPDVWTGLATIVLATDQLRGPFAILWFAPCLIMTRLIWNGLQQRIDPAGRNMALAMTVVLLAALVVSADSKVLQSPFGLLPLPGALIFMWLGHHWRDRRHGALFGVALFILALGAFIWMPPLNMRAGDLGWPIFGIAGAAAIVDRIAWLMRWLPGRLSGPLGWIGRNSLVIMFAHLGFTHYLGPYAPKVVLFVVAIGGSLAVGWLFRRNRLLKLAFLGER